VRCGIFTAKISGPNKALITFDYGISLSILRHGRLSTARIAGDVISVNGSGAPVIRSQTMADVNATQGAVAGKNWKKTATRTGKKNGWPYYYGIQPTGRTRTSPSSRNGTTTGPPRSSCCKAPGPCRCPSCRVPRRITSASAIR